MMKAKGTKQILLWSMVLILLGVLLLVNEAVELSPWVWAGCLAAAGLVGLFLFLLDTSDWLVLLAAYILWAVALLIGLVATEILQDEAVAFYALIAIALPFFGVYYRHRALWWALIPAYALLAVVGVIALAEMAGASDNLVTAYVMFAIAIPFLFVFARNRSQWWALIPGGILAVIGVGFLMTEGAAAIIGAVLLIVVGLWFLVRAFTRKEPAGQAGPLDPDAPPMTGPESDLPGEGLGQ
jgi:hypothetical protein